MMPLRISIIAAVDSNGSIYCSLTQANTNSDIILMFLSKLVALLTKEDRNWRDKTVFLLDGASYHKSSDTRELLAKFNIKVVISAPYSYDTAPIELLFAELKRNDLNPRSLPAGKK